MDTHDSHAGSLKGIGVDKTPIRPYGPETLVSGSTQTQRILKFLLFYVLVGTRSSARGQYSG